MLFQGPPGSGKSMLASRLPSILPPLSEQQAMEVASLRSIANLPFTLDNWLTPPFRSPHHTASAAALVGGGTNPKPGEISLAHRGVLFLDEFPEFDRRVLEVLREPIEAGEINISRISQQVKYPARFQLIAAMNPCPCGYLGHKKISCRCSTDQVKRYRQKISGPLLDRIDLQVTVPANTQEVVNASQSCGESSETVKQRVIATQTIQRHRQQCLNAELSSKQISQYCELNDECRQLISQAIERLGLSARAYHRTLKVARTIADMGKQKTISKEHLLEALNLRNIES